MTRNLLDDLAVATPPYRAWRPVLAMAQNDESKTTPVPERLGSMADAFKGAKAEKPEKPKERSPAELSADLRQRASAGQEHLLSIVIPESLPQEFRDRAKAAQDEGIDRINAVQTEGLEKLSAFPEPAVVASAEKKPVQHAFGTVQEEHETYKARRDAARASGTPDEKLERLVREYEERMKPAQEPPKPKAPVAAPTPTPMPTPTPEDKRYQVGEKYTESATPATVLEVNAEGRPTRLETEKQQPRSEAEPVKSEPAPSPSATETPPPKPEPKVEPKPKPKPEPREYSGGIIRSAVEWASRKTGAGAWLDTLMPRLKSVYHRQFAENRARQQEKTQGALDRATEKRDDFRDKTADARWPFKKYYAWRTRVWEKTVSKREALVNKYDLYRTRRIERHNELQRGVSERYEREMVPYRAKQEALNLQKDAAIRAINTLSDLCKESLKELKTAEGKREGRFGRRGKVAADKIRRDVKGMQARIAAQQKLLDRINKPLASAGAKIEKYEGRQRGIADIMAFSEMEGLKVVRRAKPGPLPERQPFKTFTTAAPGETAPAEAVEEGADRGKEEWTPAQFAQAWNDHGASARIADPAAFERFVADRRAQAKESGPVTLDRLLDLTEEYLTSVRGARGFAKDRRFFLRHVPKTAKS